MPPCWGECGIIAKSDVRDIVRGLKAIGKDIEAGNFSFSAALEDIHMNIEAALKDRIGEAAGSCTRPGRATTRWRRTSSCGFAIAWTCLMTSCSACTRTAGQAEARTQADCGHARLHPLADRPAGNMRASHAGLRGNASHVTARALRDARKRMNETPAGRCCAGRHLISDRSRHDCKGTGL